MKRSIALAGAVALAAPAVVGLTLMATTADRTQAMSDVPAAVVNLDEMVTVNGQVMYGGRLVAGELTSPADEADRTLNFQLVDAETAADGLADGTYAAVVTIPKEFSADLGTLNSEDPKQARITVTTNDASAAVLSEMSDAITAAAVRSLGTQVTTGFVGGVFDGMTTLADQLGTAAAGANQLAAGADQLVSGVGDAASGAGSLADGLVALDGGASQLASGAGALSSGLRTYAAGVNQTSAGASQLASGTAALSSGANSLAGGLSQLNAGMPQLTDGATQLAGGLSQLNAGMPQLTGGATQLAAGISQFDTVAMGGLEAGAAQLAAGVTQFDTTAMGPLEAGAVQLAGGTQQLSDGLAGMAGPFATMASSAQLVVQAASGLSTGVGGVVGALGQMAAACVPMSADPTVDLCLQVQGLYMGTQATATQPSLTGLAQSVVDGTTGLSGGLSRFVSPPQGELGLPQLIEGAAGVDGGADGIVAGIQGVRAIGINGPEGLQFGADSLVAGIQQVRTDGIAPLQSGANLLAGGLGQTAGAIGQLDSGAGQLAGGISGVSGATGQLTSGASQLASGLQQTNDGAQALSGGITSLASGADALASGAAQTASGAGQLAAGTGDAADGASQIASGLTLAADGAAPLVAGADELAAGLAEGANQIPAYSDSQRTAIAEIVAQPVGTDTDRIVASPNDATTVAGMVLAVGLWVGAFGAYLVLSAIPTRSLAAPVSAFRVALDGLRNGLLFGVAQGLLAGVVLPLFGVRPVNPIGAASIAVLAALSFVAIHQGLIAAFGRTVGAVVSVALLALQVAAFGVVLPAASAPAFLQSIASLAPLNLAADALTQQILGGTVHSVGRNAALLVVWALIAVAITTAAASRRKQTSVGEIRSELAVTG